MVFVTWYFPFHVSMFSHEWTENHQWPMEWQNLKNAKSIWFQIIWLQVQNSHLFGSRRANRSGHKHLMNLLGWSNKFLYSESGHCVDSGSQQFCFYFGFRLAWVSNDACVQFYIFEQVIIIHCWKNTQPELRMQRGRSSTRMSLYDLLMAGSDWLIFFLFFSKSTNQIT